MSVNSPTNPATKQADINRKLQTYGIFEAFSNGKVPSNTQIDIALNSALAHRWLARPSPKLSQEGRVLIQDLRDVIEKAKILLLTKNQGNLIQDFIWQAQISGTGSASSPNAPIGRDTAKQHGNQALDGLRTLGTLIISNGQFRKLLNDLQLLARDIAGDAASKAADRVNPSEDELNQIDEPEEDDTWHDTPDAGELKNKAKAHKPFGREGIKQAGQEARETANQQGGGIGSKISAAAKTGANSLRKQGEENTPDDSQDKASRKKEEVKDRAREARGKTKDYFKEKIPEERRDQAIYRLKKMIVEIQGHPEYQRAIDTLLSLAEQYQGYTKDLTRQTVGATQKAHETEGGITAAEDDLKILIERFANYTSLDDFLDCINQFYQDADRDPELKGWFKHLDVFIRKSLKERGYVMQDAATDEWNKISDQADFLFRDRYKNHSQRLIDEANFLGQQFDKDALNSSFAASMQKLFDDLGNDENGKPTFKPHLVKDLFQVILPDMFESVRYIPIPRIEYSDPMADAVIENLIIESNNLTPNLVEFGNDNHFRFGRQGFTTSTKHRIEGAVSGIQMDLRDISYYIHKKHGFPSVTDTGLMDIYLGGTGFSFKLNMETADKSDGRHFFKVNNVDVDVKHMNIKLKKSKFKLMFSILKPLLLRVMVPVVTKVLEKVITDKIHQADEFLYGIYLEGQKATKEAMKNPDPEHLQNMYKTYWEAFKSNLEEKQNRAKEKASDKAINVAVTKQDSMFKNINLPGGISTKATEYKQMAAQGKKWESPIFSIGNAGQTKNLPTPPTIKRRPHQTAPSKIRGPQNIGKSMDAYSKSGESEAFQQGDKYGQTGSYGGEQGNYGDPSAHSNARYDGQQDYSQSNSGYGQDQYGSQAQYGSQSAGYGQDKYASDYGTANDYGTSTGYADGNQGYSSQGATGVSQQYSSSTANQGYSSSQYPAGYTPATSGYETGVPSATSNAYGTASSTDAYGTSRSGATAGSGAGYSTSSPTATGSTLLGMNNPVLSGRV